MSWRSIATTVDSSKSFDKNELNEFLIHATLCNPSIRPMTPLSALLDQLQTKVNAQLSFVLPYENVDRIHRNDQMTLTQGIVTIAHILPVRKQVIIASGFAILDGHLIVTCAHTFFQAALHLSTVEPDLVSQTLIITHDGELFRIVGVESHLALSDLVVLKLEEGRKVTPLNVNPFPAPVTTSVLSYDFVEASISSSARPQISFTWKSAKILCYKDRCGQEARTGTYDELTSLIYSHSPSNGSSGAPIIADDSKCVVGIVRGNELSYTDRVRTGFAIPSERLFDAFKLPGIPDEIQ